MRKYLTKIHVEDNATMETDKKLIRSTKCDHNPRRVTEIEAVPSTFGSKQPERTPDIYPAKDCQLGTIPRNYYRNIFCATTTTTEIEEEDNVETYEAYFFMSKTNDK